MMTVIVRRLILAAILLPAGLQADAPLFAGHETLDLTIPLDFKTLCRPREDENCDYTLTEMTFSGPDSALRTVPIEVIIRGGWRSLTKNCSAPLLFIRFDPATTEGTPFEGQKVLPLTTHCGPGFSLEASANRQRSSTWEQYLIKEFLAHRFYNLVTPVSLKARLVSITYPNPEKPSRTISNYAFFTEHFDALAARSQADVLERGSFSAERLEAQPSAELALFQFMIGNTDWSIARQRNTLLLKTAQDSHLPVPYDFDMSGLVDAHYAGPAPGLPIDSVRERYYLGYCQPGVDWDSLHQRFLALEDEVLGMIAAQAALDPKTGKSTRRFIEKFYKLLKSEEKWKDTIVNHCQPWPPTGKDHLGPIAGP